MRDPQRGRNSERGSAATKFLIFLVVIVLVGHAGYQYVPIAYQGASFRQEMDTAVVKGLGVPGGVKPFDVVKNHVSRAAADYNVPADAVIEITPISGALQARATYTKPVNILPFGIYKYNYKFDHTATPAGYLTKE